jgi:hypothetical protein
MDLARVLVNRRTFVMGSATTALVFNYFHSFIPLLFNDAFNFSDYSIKRYDTLLQGQ